MKEHRIQKTVVDLIQWRRFLVVPFRNATIQGIYTAVSTLDTEPSITGRLHKQNTKHDKIQVIRRFLLWLVQRGVSTVDSERIREIRVPDE